MTQVYLKKHQVVQNYGSDFMVSSINGLSEKSFLNSTLLLPNCSENKIKETQTNLSMADTLGTEQDLLSKNEECYQLQDSNKGLKVGIYDWFNNNNEKVLFYTGLPRLEILCSVHDLLKTAIPENVNWKQFILATNIDIDAVKVKFNYARSSIQI